MTEVRKASSVVLWSSLAIVGVLWWLGSGLPLLTAGGSSSLISLGRLTGLVAADLLLMQVLLMARLPPLEQAFGRDDLARRHRVVGFTSFNLMIVHIVLITLGYAGASASSVLREAWQLVWNYPGMLLATASTVLLVVVSVSSARAARRRLRYESWHLLHLYAYLGVGLSIPHELWTGGDFVRSPIARIYWWALWLAAAAAVLVYRVAIPLTRSFRHKLVVDRVTVEGPGVVSVYMRGRSLDRLQARAGQFFNWRFLDGSGWSRANPYSLSATPRRGELRITAKALGEGSARLARLKPGTAVMVEGPYGRLSEAVRTRRRVTFIASGIGVTPMLAMLEEFDYGPGEAVLLYRTSSPDEVMFADELEDLVARRGARVVTLPGPRVRRRSSWLPHSASHMADDVALAQLVPDIRNHDVFVCGPEDWMSAVVAAARRSGVGESQIHIERFGW